jgi:hypothetical protein
MQFNAFVAKTTLLTLCQEWFQKSPLPAKPNKMLGPLQGGWLFVSWFFLKVKRLLSAVICIYIYIIIFR